MNSPDIDELFERLDRARSAPIPGADSVTARRIRKNALARTSAGNARRRVMVGGVAAAFVVFAGTAAALLLTTNSSPNAVQSLCYAEPSLEADAVGATVGTTANVSDCYRFWQDGTFAADGVVPALTACVLNEGGLAVLPGDGELCASLGLQESLSGSATDPAAELQDRLAALVPLGECAPFDETVASMRNVVQSLDLSGWEVSVRDDPTSKRPCASFAVEGHAMTVIVVPIPAPS